MDRLFKQKINKEGTVNDMSENSILWIHQLYSGIFRILHPKTEYIFFSSAHGVFSSMGHLLGYKTSFNKLEKTEVLPCILSDHNAMKLEVIQKKKISESEDRAKKLSKLKHKRNTE